MRKKKIESFSDYQDCRNKGFTKEFCLSNPAPNVCQCSNGAPGILIPGFKGKCLCSSSNNTYPSVENININNSKLLSNKLNNLLNTRYIQKESQLKYFYPKRSWLKNVENIIPFSPVNWSFF